MHIKYFVVKFNGDPSVGIFPAEWKITGDFYFEFQEELEAFRIKLREAWEYYSDTPIYIMTDEEFTILQIREESL